MADPSLVEMQVCSSQRHLAPAYYAMSRFAISRGVEVINCSPGTRNHVFAVADLTETLTVVRSATRRWRAGGSLL